MVDNLDLSGQEGYQMQCETEKKSIYGQKEKICLQFHLI